jgi:A/G-specific adenine glycosylase
MTAECSAAREGRQAELPGRKARRARGARESVLLIAETQIPGAASGRAILVERRPSPGIWGGLWSPPQFDDEAAALTWCAREFGGAVAALPALPAIEHAFTHFDLRLVPLHVVCTLPGQIADGETRLWYRLAEPPRLGLPQPIRALFERLQTALRVN